MMRSTILFATLILLATLGLAKRASAVVGGTPLEDAAADGVVMITGADALCSGAVIAPTVVLTAAHCLSNPNAEDYSVRGGFNALQNALFTIGASEVHQHPSFNPMIDLSHDVGILILASAAPATPLSWLRADEGDYTPGTQVGVIGYGVTGPSEADEGIRRIGLARVTEVIADLFSTDDTLGRAMCVGDAGGPAIRVSLTNPGVIIGVSSFGDPLCAEYSAFQRTDANADFIGLYAPEPSATATAAISIGALLLLARRHG